MKQSSLFFSLCVIGFFSAPALYAADDEKNPYKEELDALKEAETLGLKIDMVYYGDDDRVSRSRDMREVLVEDQKGEFAEFKTLFNCIKHARASTHKEFACCVYWPYPLPGKEEMEEFWLTKCAFGRLQRVASKCASSDDPDACIVRKIKQHYAWLSELYGEGERVQE